MPHIPQFPPKWDDWAPGDPFKLESPLPGFLRHSPWLTAEQRAEIEAIAGKWATNRAEAMTSPADGPEMVKRIATSMYESYKGRALAGLPPLLAAPPPIKRVRRKKLTPELETTLTDWALESIIDIMERTRKVPTTIEEKRELAKDVVVWAEEKGVEISEDKGLEIVESALGRYAPARR